MKRKIINIWGVIVFILAGSMFVWTQEKPKVLLIDSFTYSNSEDASARIDNWRNELEKSPQNAGMVIVYGGKISKKGEIEAHIRGIKQAFALKRIDHNRTPVISGGYRDKLTIEFWVIPVGADTPAPSSTVNVKNVRFKGVSKKIIPYECCF